MIATLISDAIRVNVDAVSTSHASLVLAVVDVAVCESIKTVALHPSIDQNSFKHITICEDIPGPAICLIFQIPPLADGAIVADAKALTFCNVSLATHLPKISATILVVLLTPLKRDWPAAMWNVSQELSKIGP